MKVQRTFKIENVDSQWYERLAESQHRSFSEMVRVILLERKAQIEEERRHTGTSSLFKAAVKKRDDCEDMLLNP